MVNRKRIWFVAFNALFLFLISGVVFGGYSVGEHVNDFTLEDVDGYKVSLYDYDGQVIVLNFFATW
jgi:cytochrome oxidase Cu insertion factor (SCO1/SenC/PrrC family)